MPKLVIVGGSYGGLWALEFMSRLKLDLEIVLISPTTHLYFNVPSPRVLVEIEKVDQMFFPIDKFVKNRTQGNIIFLQGKVTHINLLQKVITFNRNDDERREELFYDYLIISSGTRGSISAFQLNDNSHQDSIDSLKKINTVLQLEKVKKVSIIGGGPTGIELAGEIKGGFPDKEVTIYGNKPYLCHSMEKKFSDKLVKKLQALEVKIVNNKQFENYDEVNHQLFFKDDSVVSTDLVISTSSVPNSEFLQDYSLFLDNKGYIKTDDYLNLPGYKNVWVIGDILSSGCKNLHSIYNIQIPYVKESLKKHCNHQIVTKTCKKPKPFLVLPIYKNGGVGQYGGWYLPNWLVYRSKGKDYTLPRARKFFE